MTDGFKMSLHEALPLALKIVAQLAAEKAKQTKTYLVFERDGEIEKIPYYEIDAYLAR